MVIAASYNYYRSWVDYFWPPQMSLEEHLDRTTHRYQLIEMKTGNHTLQVPDGWITDFQRVDDCDLLLNHFGVNQRDKTAVLEELYTLAGENPALLERWTQIWSYRLRITLTDHVVKAYFDQYKNTPMLSSSNLTYSSLLLNTKEKTIECNLRGTITRIIDDIGQPKPIQTIQYIANIHLRIDRPLTEAEFEKSSTVAFGELQLSLPGILDAGVAGK